MHQNNTYTGFDIALWEEIAKELELAFRLPIQIKGNPLTACGGSEQQFQFQSNLLESLVECPDSEFTQKRGSK
jgi:ABC-type amino acid transport substrate-binding protein